jgi:hypothetical protein
MEKMSSVEGVDQRSPRSRQPRQSIFRVNGKEITVELQATHSTKYNVVENVGNPRRRLKSPYSSKLEPLKRPDTTDCTCDRYGFLLNPSDGDPTSSMHRAADVSGSTRKARDAKERERTEKWDVMLRDLKSGNVNSNRVKKTTVKLQERVRKGIPNSKRGEAWAYLAGVYDEDIPVVEEVDRKIRESSSSGSGSGGVPARTLDEINRDIDRTYPRHKLFQMVGTGASRKEPPHQAMLRRILQRYAAVDPEVGYCQGMGFMAGMYLIYMDEETAFRCFYQAMHKQSEIRLRDLYLPVMVEAQRVLYVFKQLGSKHLPRLWEHLEKQELDPSMYATEWAMTMFCRGFSFDLVTRVMDIYLLDGYKVVYRVMLALMKNVESSLMSADFEGIMDVLRRIPELTDAETVMDLAYSIPVRRADIVVFATEYDKIKEEEKATRSPSGRF